MDIKYLQQMVDLMKHELRDLQREQATVTRQFASQVYAMESKIEIFEDQLRRMKDVAKQVEMVSVHS